MLQYSFFPWAGRDKPKKDILCIQKRRAPANIILCQLKFKSCRIHTEATTPSLLLFREHLVHGLSKLSLLVMESQSRRNLFRQLCSKPSVSVQKMLVRFSLHLECPIIVFKTYLRCHLVKMPFLVSLGRKNPSSLNLEHGHIHDTYPIVVWNIK